MQLPPARADEAALGISERTGIPTLAARDGWLLDLEDLPGAIRAGAAGARARAARRPARAAGPDPRQR
jgi:hypothetical protein